MQQKVLSKQALYYGDVSMPKNWDIDKEKLLEHILQSQLFNKEFPFSKIGPSIVPSTHILDVLHHPQLESAKHALADFDTLQDFGGVPTLLSPMGFLWLRVSTCFVKIKTRLRKTSRHFVEQIPCGEGIFFISRRVSRFSSFRVIFSASSSSLRRVINSCARPYSRSANCFEFLEPSFSISIFVTILNTLITLSVNCLLRAKVSDCSLSSSRKSNIDTSRGGIQNSDLIAIL